MKRVGDLEIDQDLQFQQRAWRVQRIGWAVMLVLIALALLGLFGTGWLSSASASDPSGALSVDYQRFVRHDGRTTLSIEVAPEQVSGETVQLWIAAQSLNDLQVEGTIPEPQEVRTDGDRMIYVIAVQEVTAPVELSFSLRPQAMGRIEVELGLVNGPQVSFSQISYP